MIYIFFYLNSKYNAMSQRAPSLYFRGLKIEKMKKLIKDILSYIAADPTDSKHAKKKLKNLLSM